MYYEQQASEVGVCDYVLRLYDSRYDVGFQKQEDGTLAPVFDGWAGQIRNTGIGTNPTCPLPNTPAAREQSHIGSLMAAYSKHAAINAATSAGYTVEDVTYDEKTGETNLVFNTY